ncbi:ABC-three component system protein [Nitrosomonas sp. Nm34]|uniref:ABC-three component system protein n=1 Tax=Nitrosomonas sp. Nm34 TaxID=1881055 RepID=UPI0008E8F135|nr:ABC-three component system protein [Nitrosomonas sp. Nm34]SFI36794.1 hypothetical protein SAMN05428978_100746 [Nitrosomonas sp. Nm34]
MTKTHAEKTSAEDKSIGFDFQYYYFFYRLLNLKTGEKVGLEVLDDVHTELSSDRQILVQLKHSTKIKADGGTKNLTTLDPDLWKTLSNWSQVIVDKYAGREKKMDQLNFVNKTDFLLISNKSNSEENTALNTIKNFQSGNLNLSELDFYLNVLKDKTKDNELKVYIQNVLDLDTDVRKTFLENLDFDLECNDIIKKCKLAIKEKQIDERKIEDVFRNLDSQIRQDNFISIQARNKIIISFEEFYKKYRRHFDLARNEILTLKSLIGNLPDHLTDQKFIQQLIDIADIQPDDLETMAEFTRYRLFIQNNIDEWYKNGDLTANELEAFDKESKLRWRNEFRKTYRNCTQENVTEKARDLLDSMRKEKLPIATQELPTDMSNGQFYRLSDIPEIGWHKNWEEKYK